MESEFEATRVDPISLLKGIIETTPDMVAVIDRQLHLLAFNSQFFAEFQNRFGTQVWQGMLITDALSRMPTLLSELIASLGRLFQGEELTIERDFKVLSGENRLYEIRYRSLRDADLPG